MSFRTPKSSVSLENKIEDIFDENREACDCPIDYQVNYTVKEKYEKHHHNTPSAISDSIVMLWSDDNMYVRK